MHVFREKRRGKKLGRVAISRMHFPLVLYVGVLVLHGTFGMYAFHSVQIVRTLGTSTLKSV